MGDAGWDRIKRFTTKYIGVEYEKLQIDTYRQELRDAMQMLTVSVVGGNGLSSLIITATLGTLCRFHCWAY
jgi:hypothetical protein